MKATKYALVYRMLWYICLHVFAHKCRVDVDVAQYF